MVEDPFGHRLLGGVRFQSDPVERGYSVRCICGWDSGVCPSHVLADAAGEQHLDLERDRPRRRPTGGAFR